MGDTEIIGHTEMSALPFIIAVDFDGTLVTDKFPKIGELNTQLFNQLKLWKSNGCRLILWTCRDNNTSDRLLDSAARFCADQGILFDAINRNIPEVIEMFQNDTRKIYANMYIDDKNMTPSVPASLFWDPRDFKPWRDTIC